MVRLVLRLCLINCSWYGLELHLVDAETMLNAGCWLHHDSLLKGDAELQKPLLKPSHLHILVLPIGINTLWIQLVAEGQTSVGAYLLALLLVFCIWCG
ncbi:hypothetical protein Nepgr_025354 [Nepenthes gracilis]|uniref:Uncharacterized protein n=1 Tax=Nepenthes gracilis TaxID=150966 RepID=A0AAD3T7M2_NEPGR|nr:hypothetical protein Nepgr_025354 [Nepenthes gracilis]